MEKVEVNYTLSLTGSKFFDAVIYMRAKELTENYPELKLIVEKGKFLHLRGLLDPDVARRLEDELAMYDDQEDLDDED